MRRMRLDQDIRSLSEFRAEAASFLKQVHETKRPLVLTRRGRGAAVLMDAQEYEALRERLELLEDICQADRQLQAGEGLAHEAARAKVLQRLDG